MEVKVTEKMATHPLAIGDGFWERDIKLNFINYLAPTSSGEQFANLRRAKHKTRLKSALTYKTFNLGITVTHAIKILKKYIGVNVNLNQKN